MEGIRNGCLVTTKKLAATIQGSGSTVEKHQVTVSLLCHFRPHKICVYGVGTLRVFECTMRWSLSEALLALYIHPYNSVTLFPSISLHPQRKLPHYILGMGMQEAGTQLGEDSLFGYYHLPPFLPPSLLLSYRPYITTVDT